MEDQEDEEAALWVVRHMDGPVDEVAFAQWLAGAPGRQERFAALQATLMDGDIAKGARLHESRLHESLQITNPTPDNRPQRRAHRHKDQHRSSPGWRSPQASRRIALSALAAACVAALALSWPHIRYALTPAQSYETQVGEIRDIRIADGSSIKLNGASRVSVKIAPGRREVTLEAGEALFDVTHNPDHPFTVTAGDGRVTVLGTRFDVAINAEQVDLEVERGLVRFDAPSSAAASSPSHVLVGASHRSALANGQLSAPARYQATAATSWQNGWLEVSDMPLSQIIPRLERWSDKAIIVRDNRLLNKRVAGRFHLSEPDIVLDNLAILYGFRVEDTGRAYILDQS